MTVTFFDIESFRIGPEHGPHPKVVCFAWKKRGGAKGLIANGDPDAEAKIREVLASASLLVGVNVGYDFTCLAKSYPSLLPLLWSKEYEDLAVMSRLHYIAEFGEAEKIEMPDGSKQPLAHSLAAMAERHLGLNLSKAKDDPNSPRLRFGELDGLSVDSYPQEFLDYVMDDVDIPERIWETMQDWDLPTARFESLAAIALEMMTTQGLETDPEEYAKLSAQVEAVFNNTAAANLISAGIIRPSVPAMPHKRQLAKAAELCGGMQEDWEPFREALQDYHGIKFKAAVEQSKDMGALKALVESLHPAPPKTETGQTSCSDEVLEEIEPFSDVVRELRERQSFDKLRSTELPRVCWEGKVAPRVWIPYRSLVSSGRTSSASSDLFPSANGQNVLPAARAMYRAPEGHCLWSIDYAGLEQGTAAQQCYELFGKSILRDKINAGVDTHAFLGHGTFRLLRPEEAPVVFNMTDPWKTDPKLKFWRNLAKPVGLGFPGGLGPSKMISIASAAPYSVPIVALAKELPVETYDLRKTAFAWNLERVFETREPDWSKPWVRALALMCYLKEVWLETYPEFREFFKWVAAQEDPHHPGKLAYTSCLGFRRSNLNFTEAANGSSMQTRAAHGAKRAVIEVMRAGFLAPLFIHDEVVVSLPDGETPEAVQAIMEAAMAEVCPDVTIKTEAKNLGRNWSK